MKKCLISFLLLTSIFIGYNKVGATTISLDYSDDNSFLTDIFFTSNNANTLSFVNDTLIPYLDTNFNDNYYYFITLYVGDSSPHNMGVNLYILPKLSGSYGIFNHTRSGYTNFFDIRYWQNGYPENFVGTSDQFSYSFYTGVNSSTLTTLDNFLQNPVYTYTDVYTIYNNNLTTMISNVSSSPSNGVYKYLSLDANTLLSRQKLLYYSNYDFKFCIGPTYYNNGYYSTFDFKYNDYNDNLSLGDSIPFYYNYVNDNNVVVNLVKDLGNNTFGFYQNVVGINATSLSGVADTLSIICEENKPFENGYCSMNYNDLISHNSDINVFNNYATDFTQLFGNNSGYLYNDKYYLYSFRIQKPFVPQVGNIFINSLTNNSNQVNILNVYANDGGSYTDYVVKFKIENSNYDSNTNLKDILVVFRDGLGTYYNNFIPNTFNYSVYRSFKLQYFDSEPTMSNVNDFYNNNDLTYIDGVSSQNSFFTDNEFNSFGFGGIITAPFRFLYALENYESCSDINVPFPHSNQNLTLTCVRKNIPSSLNPLIVILQVILSGVVSYRIAVGTLKIIKDVSSPEDSNIEVVDL